MEYLTIRKDLRNIDLKSLYFGGHYIFRLTFDFFVKRLNEICRINAMPNLVGKLIKS